MCSELIIVSFLFLTVDDKYFVIEIHTFTVLSYFMVTGLNF